MVRPPVRFLPPGREGGGVLPWVIAVMMYLCALAAAAGIALNGALTEWSGDLTNRITVQITHADAAERARQTEAALARLADTPGVASARALTDPEVAALLEPWLGSGNVTDDLPVPTLIDVMLDRDRRIDLDALAAKLARVAPDAQLDNHQQWLGRLLKLSGMLEFVALSVVAMVVLSTAAIVVFGTRTGLASHRDSVEIMHLIGAEDRIIAGEFQYRYMLHGFKGGVIGVVAAGATLAGLGRLIGAVGEGLVPLVALSPMEFALLALLPFAASALTMLTARVTVRHALARMV